MEQPCCPPTGAPSYFSAQAVDACHGGADVISAPPGPEPWSPAVESRGACGLHAARWRRWRRCAHGERQSPAAGGEIFRFRHRQAIWRTAFSRPWSCMGRRFVTSLRAISAHLPFFFRLVCTCRLPPKNGDLLRITRKAGKRLPFSHLRSTKIHLVIYACFACKINLCKKFA